MKLRAVSPLETIVKYGMIELFAISFFLLVYKNLTPYRYFSVMQALQYALLGAVALFILLPVYLELFGFGSIRFFITKRGVRYQKRGLVYRLAWEEIQHIALCTNLYGRVSSRCYLVFYGDENPRLITGRSEFHPLAFGVQYRKGLSAAIRQYTDLPIENMEKIPPDKR